MEEEITVTVKILGEEPIEPMILPLDTTVDTIRELASDYTNIQVEQMRVLYRGHALEPSITLDSLNVHDEITLNIVSQSDRPTRPPPKPPMSEKENELRRQITQLQIRITRLTRDIAEVQNAINGNRISEVIPAFAQLKERAVNTFAEINTLQAQITYHKCRKVRGFLSIEDASPEDSNANQPSETIRPRQNIPLDPAIRLNEADLAMIEADLLQMQGDLPPVDERLIGATIANALLQ